MASNFEEQSYDNGATAQLDFDKIKQQLQEVGVAVVPNVLTHAQCDEYVGEIREWLTRFGDDGFPKNTLSLIHSYNVGFLDPVWKTRLAAKKVFEQVWGTEKLLTSFDGIAVAEPPETSSRFDFWQGRYNLHFDQSPMRQGLHAYQGAVYLEEADEDDWCFAVMETTHRLFEQFFEEFEPSPRSEFRVLKQREITWLNRQDVYAKRVAVPRGALVLWDSRLVHAGAPPKSGRVHADRWRFVVFTCMTPAAWATEKDLAVKRDGYHNLKVGRHWPSTGVSHFRSFKNPGLDLTEQSKTGKTAEARRLAGVLPYDFNDGQPNGPPSPTWAPDYR